MADQATIQYISGLMSQPTSLTEADKERVAALLRQYPYMAPLRYIEAAQKQAAEPWNAGMLAGVRPYVGNWLQFCAFIDPQPHKSVLSEENVVSDNDTIEALVEIAQNEESVTIAGAGPEVQYETAVEQEVEDAEEVVAEAEGESMEEEDEPVYEEAEPVAEEIHEVRHSHIETVLDEAVEAANQEVTEEEPLISPVYTEDYFRQQGVKVADELPERVEELKMDEPAAGGLMVVMSFSEWLLHFKHTSQKQKEETEDQKALKAMWQKEKLAAAAEEENEEIPENVFEMAVTSITNEDDLASEPLAQIYLKQGKYDKAIEMYRKLSLRNPQKNTYFAHKIEEILKEKQS